MFRLGMWVGLGGAGTVCHMGGCSRLLMWLVVVVLFTLAFDSSPIKETFAKPTVIPAKAGIYSQNAT